MGAICATAIVRSVARSMKKSMPILGVTSVNPPSYIALARICSETTILVMRATSDANASIRTSFQIAFGRDKRNWPYAHRQQTWIQPITSA